MNFKELKFLILADLHRYNNKLSWGTFFKEYVHEFGFKYIFWWRVNKYFKTKSKLLSPVRLIFRFILRQNSIHLGIDISLQAEVDPGFKIEHFGGIIVNSNAKIGKRCSMLQGVTIGEYFGAPSIGEFVFIGPGAKLIGNVKVGNNVIVGANSVVTKDIPDNAVVVGVPGKVISRKGNIRKNREEIHKLTIRTYRQLCPPELWNKYGLDKQESAPISESAI